MTAKLITGAPGTGKTERIIAAAAEFIANGGDPARLLVLAPTRTGATRIRDGLARRITTSMSTAPTRAWAAYAFDLLRRAHTLGSLPGVQYSPKLLSGPEQDVMIGEILGGHREGAGAGVRWPADLQEALGTRGFRHEIRDFFDRMAEYDVSVERVQELAEQLNRPAWQSVAALHTEYRQIRRLRAPHAYDPAALIHEACNFLFANPDWLSAERERFDLILIDDVQELSPATYRLLNILCAQNPQAALSSYRGQAREDVAAALTAGTGQNLTRHILMTCCTETVVQGFRGARPDLARTLGESFPTLETEYLNTSYRMGPGIAAAWGELARRLPVITGAKTVRELRAPAAEAQEQALLQLSDEGDLLDPRRYSTPPEGVFGYMFLSPQDEVNQVAQLLLEDYLYRGAAYARSAIVVRDGSRVANIRRVLAASGIPTVTGAALTPVRDEPAVRPFLDALSLLMYARERGAEQLHLPDNYASPSGAETTSDGEEPLTAETIANASHTTAEEDEAKLARRSLEDVLAEENRTNPASGAHNAITLLTSRLGGASSMDVRRLRQQLRAAELRAGGRRSSDDLLLGALLNPEALPDYGVGTAIRRVSRVLAAGQQALNAPGANAETVLWALWQASGLEKTWVNSSAATGPEAERAHRNLDAMIGLFEAATRFVDQMPGSSAEQFLDYIDAQDLPMDTLAARGKRYDAVEILTPALAAGRQWDTVYVCGIQEGTWPNTKVRGSLLNTGELSDICEMGVEAAQKVRMADRIRAVRHDELRMFATAISRARKRLVLTAVSSTDEAPSEFFDILVPEVRAGEVTRVRRPMTLRALVAQLRRNATVEEHNPALAHAAAAQLHRLADAQVPGAHPRQWWGLLPLSTQEPAFTPRRRQGQEPEKLTVPISPSRLETIHKSPLDWFVAAARAEAQTDTSRSLGTLIHAIAEEYPAADYATLSAVLQERLTTLALPETWEGEETRRRAEKMIQKLAVYFKEIMPGDGRTLVGVEGAFKVRVPGEKLDAQISGRVDRLEVTEDGRYMIVDLKTGRTKPAKADISQHAQLAAYQVAVEAGAGDTMSRELGTEPAAHPGGAPGGSDDNVYRAMGRRSAGAALVQLGDGTAPTAKNRPQEQPPLDPDSDEWAVELIRCAAELIAGALIQARHRPGEKCRLPEICPLCPQGRQVTQG